VIPPLPTGFRIAIDADTKQLDGTTLFGGSPARVLRLSASGLAAWTELRHGPVTSTASGVLARRLTDAGLAHPRPPAAGAPDVTVIVPVRDRPTMLAGCLAATGRRHPVVVVDDGSTDPRSVAAVAAEHGATLVCRSDNGGPGAARNSGLDRVTSEFVAFLDSDCVAKPDWIDLLAGHFGDPLVAAVAPQVVALAASDHAGSGLDLGARAGRVVPGTRIAYVPTAALIVRRAALCDVGVFDAALRYGEDVDLVWRLHAAGWRVRYDPAVQVRHHEPGTWSGLLARRFRYGTSAGPLARRHPTALAPLVLHPWPTLTVAGLLARRPLLAAASFAGSVLAMNRTLRRAGLPTTGVLPPMLTGVRQTWLGMGRYATQFAAPVLAAALLNPGGATRVVRWGRRAAAASLLLGPPLTEWVARRPALDPVRFTLVRVADDIAYGAGVWAGCVRANTGRPLRPTIAWRPLRITSPDTKGRRRWATPGSRR
jgi:mycofactocin system glycosyltransferase